MSQDLPNDLRAFLSQSPVALAVASPEGDCPLIMVNGKFSALTGFSNDEVAGRNCRFLQRDANNETARARIHAFLATPEQANVRTDLVNFRKDGTPFINLLYMSKLRNRDGSVRYIFASQFDISRSRAELLADYDSTLTETLTRLGPVISETDTIVDGSLLTVANSATMIAQAKMLLASLSEAPSLD